ncbi:MAG: SH3 domain-containing protein [Polyangiaceae bacterium]
MSRARPRGFARFARLLLGVAVWAGSFTAALLGAPNRAHAEAPAKTEYQAFARVVVDETELRAGPSVSYRVIHTAHRDETLALDARQTTGYWLQVTLPDGRIAYVLGDTVQTYAVDPDAPNAPGRPGLLAPPPLTGARGGLAIVGGVLRTPVIGGGHEAAGYLEFKPSIVVHPTLTLDGFIGLGAYADGAQLLYGGGATIHFAPDWALCPYLSLGAGGFSVVPNSDTFVLKGESLYAARAGGGFLFALRNRILVRLEATNLTLFRSDTFRNAQTFTGGFGVYF